MAYVRDGRLALPDLATASLSPARALPSVSSDTLAYLSTKDHKIDFLCWIPRSSLDLAPVVPAVSDDVVARRALQRLLTRLALLHTDSYAPSRAAFDLNGPPNLFFLQASHYIELHQLGSFSVLPSLPHLQSLLMMLEFANADWNRRYLTHKSARRMLTFSISAFTDPEFDVVLHQTELVDFGKGVVWRGSAPPTAAQEYDAPLTRPDSTFPTKWVARLPDQPAPSPFPYPPSSRTPSERVNPLCLVLLASVRHSQRLTLSDHDRLTEPRAHQLFQLVQAVRDALFWCPEGFPAAWLKQEEERERSEFGSGSAAELLARTLTFRRSGYGVVTEPSAALFSPLGRNDEEDQLSDDDTGDSVFGSALAVQDSLSSVSTSEDPIERWRSGVPKTE